MSATVALKITPCFSWPRHDVLAKAYAPICALFSSVRRRTQKSRTGRMTQSAANPSGVKFPVHQGKYKEFSRFRALNLPRDTEKPLCTFGFLSKFPTQRNRDYFGGTGIFFDATGNFHDGGGKFILVGARRETSVFFGVHGVLRRHKVLKKRQPQPSPLSR